MQIKISSKHVELTPALEEYAQKKAEKLLRYYDRIQQVDVVIDKEKNHFVTEIILTVEHHEPFVSRCLHEDLYASIDLCMDRSTRQITDHKSRIRDDKHHTPTGGIEP